MPFRDGLLQVIYSSLETSLRCRLPVGFRHCPPVRFARRSMSGRPSESWDGMARPAPIADLKLRDPSMAHGRRFHKPVRRDHLTTVTNILALTEGKVGPIAG